MRDDSTAALTGALPGAPAGAPAGADRLHADPAVIAHAAGRMLDLWRELSVMTRPVMSNLDTGEHAFGSLRGATQLWRAHAESLVEMQAAIDRLGQVLAGDADRLYRVAFAVDAADRCAADRMRRGGT